MSKTYLPNRDIGEFYRYKIQDNSIKVYTDMFRDSSKSTITCYEVYTDMDYLKSNDDVCTMTEKNLADLDYNSFTSDFWYRTDLSNILIIFLVLFIFCIYMPYRIISRWFGRWLKV